MIWSDAQQRLARAVFKATQAGLRHAPMDYPVSVGNVLLRSFPRVRLPAIQHGTVSGAVVTAAALTVRDATTDSNRFSGVIPAGIGQPMISANRRALYCSKDTAAQMAEVLHYAPGSAARPPGSMPFTLQTLQGKCMALMKPVRDINLVTLDSTEPQVQQFFDSLQRSADAKVALSALRYTDIRQAVFSPTDYAAARGLGLGLVKHPDIDGLEIGSARSFETLGATQSVFQSGTNVLVFGPDQVPLTRVLRIVSVHLIDPDASGRSHVLTLKPNAVGDFVVASSTPL